MGREPLMSPLNDPALRIRVLDKGPKTLDETMAVVTQMEAYSNASNAGQKHTGQAGQTDDVPEKRRVRLVSPSRETESDKRIKLLEENLERQNEEIKRLKQQALRASNFRGYQNTSGKELTNRPSQPPMA